VVYGQSFKDAQLSHFQHTKTEAMDSSHSRPSPASQEETCLKAQEVDGACLEPILISRLTDLQANRAHCRACANLEELFFHSPYRPACYNMNADPDYNSLHTIN
jgi:hypothetical protein